MRDRPAPPEMVRCVPADCDEKVKCLRFRATIPHTWAQLADFSATGPCVHFVALDTELKARREVKPWPAQ